MPNYTRMFGSKQDYQEALDRLDVPSASARVGHEHWMSSSDCGPLVPNASSRPLIILGEQPMTYLPNRVGPGEEEADLWPIVIAFVQSNHWVAVELQEVDGVLPFPPVWNGWNKAKNTLPEALRWEAVLQVSFDMWQMLGSPELDV